MAATVSPYAGLTGAESTTGAVMSGSWLLGGLPSVCSGVVDDPGLGMDEILRQSPVCSRSTAEYQALLEETAPKTIGKPTTE